ncbi:MFS transporter [Streptomyces sp. NPDC057565]|uniref:MFS transporter n=1 Tax=Streptomyces sp. NPDC057565 TaxID=3346169 RepID=UPI0036872225
MTCAVSDLETSPQARRQRRLVAIAQLTSLSCWFSATAVAPALRADLGIGAAGAVLLTSSVQIGFVVGAVASAASNLADRFDPTRVAAAGAALAALCTVALTVLADGLAVAVLLRLLTGAALACVYPVNMKIMASWSPARIRGRAFGVLIGALTLGSAVPQLIRGIEDLPWQGVMLGAAILTLVGAGIAATLVHPGPERPGGPVHLNPRYAVAMFAQRGPRLANLGYFGHMWELYALWTWLPTFLLASQTAADGPTAGAVNLTAFAAIGVAGAAGCLLGGLAADRLGRAPAAVWALAVSGICCVASPLFYGRPLALVLPFLLVWGAAVIADSGVFSTALSETADPRFVGTALTAQTAIGFLLTVATIHLVPLLADAVGWQWAFWPLALGPLAGATAMARFGTAPRPRPAA